MTLFEHGGLLPSRFDPLGWHIHEMLFGFVMAAIAGFLLTAVANWTGRPPLHGWLLGLLVILWLAGRMTSLFSLHLPLWLAVGGDLAFPALLVPVIVREIILARNWRNLFVAFPVILLGAANLLMYLEAGGGDLPAGLGWRLAIAAVLILVSVVGGRIVPAFTRNWLAKRGADGPVAHGLVDRVALGVSHSALLLWAFLPERRSIGALLLLAAALNAWRLLRWRGTSTAAEPMLLILHIGYGWLTVGMALLGMASMGWAVPLSAALHSLTIGAMATMILAVMTRATRGHTGRALSADRWTGLIYISVSAAAATRVLAAFDIGFNAMLTLSAFLWVLAFVVFLVVYGPMLLRKRL
jgi:uncharacterized protein involved in response to NO